MTYRQNRRYRKSRPVFAMGACPSEGCKACRAVAAAGHSAAVDFAGIMRRQGVAGGDAVWRGAADEEGLTVVADGVVLERGEDDGVISSADGAQSAVYRDAVVCAEFNDGAGADGKRGFRRHRYDVREERVTGKVHDVRTAIYRPFGVARYVARDVGRGERK